MLHSDRVRWFEAAYARIREDLIPEAPVAAAITVGWPTKKRQGKDLCVGECHFDVFSGMTGHIFGAEALITLHPIQGDDVVLQLATLAHEMIHHALPPEAKHKKPFQVVAKRIGLCPPWPSTAPDGDLQHKLRGILLDVERELGFTPTGHFVPKPPPERKPASKKSIRCSCDVPRTISIPAPSLSRGAIVCGVCQSPFRVMVEVPSPTPD